MSPTKPYDDPTRYAPSGGYPGTSGDPNAGYGTPPGYPPGDPNAGYGTPPGYPPGDPNAGYGTPPGYPPGDPNGSYGPPPGGYPPGDPNAGYGYPPGYPPNPGASGYPQPGYGPPAMWGADPSAPFGRHPMTGEPLSDKDKLTAGLLEIFLGWCGAGRWYLGDYGIATAQLLTCGGLHIWSLIDGIMMLTGKVRDKNGRLLRD